MSEPGREGGGAELPGSRISKEEAGGGKNCSRLGTGSGILELRRHENGGERRGVDEEPSTVARDADLGSGDLSVTRNG